MQIFFNERDLFLGRPLLSGGDLQGASPCHGIFFWFLNKIKQSAGEFLGGFYAKACAFSLQQRLGIGKITHVGSIKNRHSPGRCL